jgi:hypothetical protein
MGRLLAAVHQITAAGWDYVTTGIVDSKPSNTAYMLGQFAVENAVVADPLLDLAKTDYFALRHSENKRRAFIRGYGSLPPGWGATRGSLPPPPRPGVLELVGFGREAAVLADIRTDLEEIISNDVAQ